MPDNIEPKGAIFYDIPEESDGRKQEREIHEPAGNKKSESDGHKERKPPATEII